MPLASYHVGARASGADQLSADGVMEAVRLGSGRGGKDLLTKSPASRLPNSLLDGVPPPFIAPPPSSCAALHSSASASSYERGEPQRPSDHPDDATREEREGAMLVERFRGELDKVSIVFCLISFLILFVR